jgi:hypothetical protein
VTAQFFHAETYAPVGSHGKRNLYDVLAEASRTPGSHPHVLNARPPVVVYGRHPTDLVAIIDARLSTATDRGRRRLPRTFPVLLAAVASIPVQPADMAANLDVRRRVDAWVANNVKFAIDEFGSSLESVIAHDDERFFHLHAFAVPIPNPDTQALSAETVWKPLAAQGRVRRAGGSRRAQRDAYKTEAKLVLDRYYATVGAPSELQRAGPNRARISRAAHLARTHQVEEEARRNAEVEQRQVEIERREANLDSEITRRNADYRAALVQATTREINAIREDDAKRFRRAKESAQAVVARLAIAENEVERLAELLREAGIEVDANRRRTP